MRTILRYLSYIHIYEKENQIEIWLNNWVFRSELRKAKFKIGTIAENAWLEEKKFTNKI